MNAGTPRSILIVKTSAIGDVIQTFDALEYLRTKFPDARIDWVVEQGIAPLLRAHPMIDHVIEIKSKAWRRSLFQKTTREELRHFSSQLKATTYDVLFDLQGNAKSAAVTSCAKAKAKVGFGWNSVREKCNLLVTNQRFNLPLGINIRLKYLGLVKKYFSDFESFEAKGVRLNLSEEEINRLGSLIPKNQGNPLLMVCFGSKWPNKRLDEGTLTSLLEKIAADSSPSFYFIFGDEEERRFAEKLANHFGDCSQLVGNLSLPLWQGLMWEMDGVIAVDSAALHLCGTTQTPSLSVFGPSLASAYKPMEERHAHIQGACPYEKTFSSRCPLLRTCSTGACIRNLPVDTLFEGYLCWKEAFMLGP